MTNGWKRHGKHMEKLKKRAFLKPKHLPWHLPWHLTVIGLCRERLHEVTSFQTDSDGRLTGGLE